MEQVNQQLYVVSEAGGGFTFTKYSPGTTKTLFVIGENYNTEEEVILKEIVVSAEGKFSLILQAPPDSVLEEEWYADFPQVSISDKSSKNYILVLSINDSEVLAITQPEINETETTYKISYNTYTYNYFDKDCTANGTSTITDDETGEKTTVTFNNCTFKKGWNLVKVATIIEYSEEAGSSNKQTISIASEIPSAAKWVIGFDIF